MAGARLAARGVLTLLDGDPGVGKSTLAVELAAHVSRGTSIVVPPPVLPEPPPYYGDRPREQKRPPAPPPPAPPRPPAGVLLLSAEDDPARVIRPRLEAAGADLQRVFVLDHLPGRGDQPVQLPRDVAALRKIIERQGVALLVIDPLMAYLGRGINVASDPHVRRALHRLKVLAEQTQCALLIIRHLNKTAHLPALYRGGGSIGILGACRLALVVGKDPTDENRRVLAMNKCNLSERPPSLCFHLEARGTASALVWDGACDWTAEEVLTRVSDEVAEQLSRVDECAAFIRQLLETNGEMWSRDLESWCRSQRFAERTIIRAQETAAQGHQGCLPGLEARIETGGQGGKS